MPENHHDTNLVTLSSPLIWAIVCALIFLTPVKTWSQEFRIESQVYTEASNLPVSQNVTLFSEGIVYEFQMSNQARPKPVETVIFESRTKMIILLDPQRKVRLEIPEIRLMKIVDSIRRELLQDARTKHLVEDRFKEDNDWATGWVTLESPRITYRYTGTRPTDPTVLPVYYEFLDVFTRLKATDPTQPPPFQRMELNNSIRGFGRMPTEVQKTVKGGGLYKKDFKAHSKHVVVNKLSDLDRKRIAQAKLEWLNFKPVDLTKYRQLNGNSNLIFPKITEPAEQVKSQPPKIQPNLNESGANPDLEELAVVNEKLDLEIVKDLESKPGTTVGPKEAPPKLDSKVVPASNNQMLTPILNESDAPSSSKRKR